MGGGCVGTILLAAEGGGARSGRRMEDSINHPLRNINDKCEGGGDDGPGAAWPTTVIHAAGNSGVHGGTRKGGKARWRSRPECYGAGRVPRIGN
jgi:hypothetical protein